MTNGAMMQEEPAEMEIPLEEEVGFTSMLTITGCNYHQSLKIYLGKQVLGTGAAAVIFNDFIQR